MVIQQKLTYEGDKGNAELETVFDSGAAISIVKADKVKHLGTFVKTPHPLIVKLGDGTSVLTFNETVHLEFNLNGLRLWDDFFVSNDLSDEVIFGAPTLQKWHIKLDFEHGNVVTDPKVARMRL